MKSFYTYKCLLITMVMILTQELSGQSCFTMQAQIPSTPMPDDIRDAYFEASGRFIENAGLFGDALFMGKSGDRDILFYHDHIAVFRYEDIPQLNHSRCPVLGSESFMSKKLVHPPDHNEPLYRRVAGSLRLFPESEASTPTPLGRRVEVVNYLGPSATLDHTTGVATWDSLHYGDRNQWYTLTFFFINGRLYWEFKTLGSAPVAVTAFISRLQHELHTLFGNNEVQTRPSIPSPMADGRIMYSTYLGGSKPDGIRIVIPLSDTEFIFVGGTRSPDFPLAGAAYDSTFRGDTSSVYATMVFITRVNIVKKQILFSTYFGGSDLDGLASAIYRNGMIFLAGSTWSDDLPVTANAWQPRYRGNGDGYVAALTATGSELVFCSYIGGSGVENLMDMKIDAQDNLVITGLTDSWNYPTTSGVVQSRYGGGEDDIFVTKFNHDASELVFSTFIGGAGWDEGRSLDFTPDGNILVAGYTNSNDFPVTQDALYGSRSATDEGCVFILTPGGKRLVYSSYIAWNTHEEASSASIDAEGVMTVFGITTSSNLPVNAFSFQKQKGEAPSYHPTSEDFYVLRYRLRDRDVLACTYLGGSSRERYPRAFVVMADGRVMIAGTGSSTDYPVTERLDPTESGDYAINLSILNPALSDLSYSVRLGGSNYTSLHFASVFHQVLLLSGFTYSLDYPITTSAMQPEHRGMTDAFFTIIDLSSVLISIPPTRVPSNPALEAYPQPAGTTLHIVQRVDPAAIATVTLHDCLGRLLRRTSAEAGSDGMLRVMLDVVDLRPGVYDCRISSGSRSSRRLVSILR